MSHSDNQIVQVVVDDDDDSEEVVGGVRQNYEQEKQKQKKRGFFCYRRNIRRAKQVVLSKFKHTSTKPHLSPPPPPPSGTVVADSKGFCFCFKKPLTLESSPVESLCSDPNHPNFSYDLLKSLIENNDFYSKESNPHLLP